MKLKLVIQRQKESRLRRANHVSFSLFLPSPLPTPNFSLCFVHLPVFAVCRLQPRSHQERGTLKCKVSRDLWMMAPPLVNENIFLKLRHQGPRELNSENQIDCSTQPGKICAKLNVLLLHAYNPNRIWTARRKKCIGNYFRLQVRSPQRYPSAILLLQRVIPLTAHLVEGLTLLCSSLNTLLLLGIMAKKQFSFSC